MFIASALGGNYISSPRHSIKAIVIPAASCDHYITMRALATQRAPQVISRGLVRAFQRIPASSIP